MPFIPHTVEEVESMLATIGVASIEDLFDEIPSGLRAGTLDRLADGVSEMAMLQALGERAAMDEVGSCFLGAGSYDHHIPAAVWDLTARGEFMTAYTPYQAEASQGTLQLIYEYQTMLAGLTGLDVSNASVYDGASGLAEAILMAIRANKKSTSRQVLLGQTVHPHFAATAQSIVHNQGVTLKTMAMDANGRIDMACLDNASDDASDVAAIVVQQPNFFGLLEDVDALTTWAHERGALVVAVVNPLSLALLRPPGQWAQTGADIACGDGQPFGIPMSSGGPSFGFICCKQALVRQMPGRIIGRTEDMDGRTGFVLTLQAREQHIRRGKATSNICTNQGLLVTAGTIYLSLLGAEGLTQVANACHTNTQALVAALAAIDGVTVRYPGGYFHERVLDLPRPAHEVVAALLERHILGGLALGSYYSGMDNALLVCATEKRTAADIQAYASALRECLA